MGFDASNFAGAVTSGEVTHERLSTRPTPFWQQLGSQCLHFTWGARGSVSLDGYNVTVRGIAVDVPPINGQKVAGLTCRNLMTS